MGFIYADGYVCTGKNTFGITLHSDDSYILEKLKQCIEYDGPIRIQKPKIDKRGIKYSEHKYLILQSSVFKNHLIDKGVFEKKTYHCNFPTNEQVSNDLIRHFIRGFMDGDGCVKYTKLGQISVGFVGSLHMMQSIQRILEKELNLKKNKILTKYENILYELRYGGNKIAKKLYNFLYSDATVFLYRKKNKFVWKT